MQCRNNVHVNFEHVDSIQKISVTFEKKFLSFNKIFTKCFFKCISFKKLFTRSTICSSHFLKTVYVIEKNIHTIILKNHTFQEYVYDILEKSSSNLERCSSCL